MWSSLSRRRPPPPPPAAAAAFLRSVRCVWVEEKWCHCMKLHYPPRNVEAVLRCQTQLLPLKTACVRGFKCPLLGCMCVINETSEISLIKFLFETFMFVRLLIDVWWVVNVNYHSKRKYFFKHFGLIPNYNIIRYIKLILISTYSLQYFYLWSPFPERLGFMFPGLFQAW